VGTKSRWAIMSEIDASLRQLGMDYLSPRFALSARKHGWDE
jgi:hypothetical protein